MSTVCPCFDVVEQVAFAAVDCTKHSALCQSNDVSGYPTFKYFNYGKNDIKYTGGREVKTVYQPISILFSCNICLDAHKIC
jgi:hypothetical protein